MGNGRFGGSQNNSRGGYGNRGGGGGRSSGNRSNSRGGYGAGSRGGNNQFTRIGSVTVTKKTVENLGDEVLNDLKGSGIQLWAEIFLKQGVDAMNLRHGDKVLISLKDVEGAPDFVVGTLSIGN